MSKRLKGFSKVESLERRSLLSAADLDPTFGNAGVQMFADRGEIIDMQALSDGKVLAAGANYLARFKADAPSSSAWFQGNARCAVAAWCGWESVE